MSAKSFPWDVLGLTSDATEKDVRRAYAVRLKQIDTAKNPDGFEVLRRAYEAALLSKRRIESQHHFEPVDEDDSADEAEVDDEPVVAVERVDLTAPFKTMLSLVEKRDYSVNAWQRLLNDPLLDTPGANSAFEYALVAALSESELKTEYTLSAGKAWRDLIETRYGWVSDGLRYTRQFPRHPDLRQVLVELGRASRPLPYSPVPKKEKSSLPWWGIALAAYLLLRGVALIAQASPQ